MIKIDLHTHTTASDGTFSPTELVQEAKRAGLAAVAVTDHDSSLGYEEAAKAGKELGVEVIEGIEISTKFFHTPDKGVAVHILGYYIDGKSPAIKETLDWVVNDRDKRNRKMAELMAADGIKADYDEMKARFGEVIGRPNFGELLIEQGYARDMQDAFDRFIEKGQKYYQPRTIMPLQKSVELIVAAGGVPVLAHPFQYRYGDSELRKLIQECMSYGLKGIECRYSGYDIEKVAYLEALAEEYGLVKSGGSDFHGENKKHISLGNGINGELNVPYDFLEKIKRLAGKS